MAKLSTVPSPKTATYIFRSFLYNDPFFTKVANRLKERITENHGGKAVLPHSSNELSSTSSLLYDLDLVLLRAVVDKYKIRTDDLLMYYVFMGTGVLEDKIPIPYIDNEGRVFVSLYPENTIEDIHAIWPYVQKLQSSISGKQRNRPVVDYSLIYAIYRLKIAGKSNKIIFNLYDSGELPYYTGESKQFLTKESLMSHYWKHDPTRIT